jgi:hypothetical protein
MELSNNPENRNQHSQSIKEIESYLFKAITLSDSIFVENKVLSYQLFEMKKSEIAQEKTIDELNAQIDVINILKE